MRILFQTRPDHEQTSGGDKIVIEALRERLLTRGFEVDVSGVAAPSLDAYDVVHLFNLELMPYTFRQAENARRQGRPYLLTPIYWPPRMSAPWRACAQPEKTLRLLLPERVVDALSLAAEHRRSLRDSDPPARSPSLSRQSLRRTVVEHAVLVLASCEAERNWLLRDFVGALPPERVSVARFGYSAASPAPPTTDVPEPGYFLCVGGFGPRKNQLNLARALGRVHGARLVFIGGASPGNRRYLRAVRAEAPRGSLFLSDQPHGALPRFYERARAVVQPSFVELPGLVAMEAVASRRPTVVADHEPAAECFAGLATFADPASPESIREACLSAVAPDTAGVARFLAQHDWSRVAKPVEDAYLALAESRGLGPNRRN